MPSSDLPDVRKIATRTLTIACESCGSEIVYSRKQHRLICPKCGQEMSSKRFKRPDDNRMKRPL